MQPGMVDRPLGTGDWLLMYFHSPACMGAAADPPLQPAGRMMIWAPGRWQIYGRPTRGFLHSWMHATGKAVESLLRLHRVPQGRPFALPNPRAFLDFLAALHRELSRPAPDAIIAANLFENWLRDLGRSLAGEIKSAPAHVFASPASTSTMPMPGHSRWRNLARLSRLSPAHISQPNFVAISDCRRWNMPSGVGCTTRPTSSMT